MVAVNVLRPIIFYSKLCGIAPFKFTDQKIEISQSWFRYSCFLLLCNTSVLIFLAIILFFKDPDSGNIITNDFTLFLNLVFCISANSVTSVAMLLYCKKISHILNEVITIENTFLWMDKFQVNYLRKKYFSTLTMLVSIIVFICFCGIVTNPFNNSLTAVDSVFFFFSEIVLGVYICNYYGIVLLIGLLYIVLKQKLRACVMLISRR